MLEGRLVRRVLGRAAELGSTMGGSPRITGAYWFGDAASPDGIRVRLRPAYYVAPEEAGSRLQSLLLEAMNRQRRAQRLCREIHRAHPDPHRARDILRNRIQDRDH